jgi:DNA-binding MarR family transcriptional regulator
MCKNLDVKIKSGDIRKMDHVDRIIAQWQAERPDLDVGPMEIIGRMKRLHDRLAAGMDRVFSAHGLNSASFDVLATLRRSGSPFELSPSALIEWTMVTSGTMTNRLDRLEKQGLIERRPNPEDGRGSVVALTEQGFGLIDQVVTEHVRNQERLLEGLPPDVRGMLSGSLKRWLSDLDQKAGPS